MLSVITTGSPLRLTLLLLDSVFHGALKIGSICSLLPLSLSLDHFHHLGSLAEGCSNSFDHAKFLTVLHASVFEQPLCRTGFSLTLSSYHLSHVARWHIGEGLSFERTIQRQVLSDVPHFPTKSACNCPPGTETL